MRWAGPEHFRAAMTSVFVPKINAPQTRQCGQGLRSYCKYQPRASYFCFSDSLGGRHWPAPLQCSLLSAASREKAWPGPSPASWPRNTWRIRSRDQALQGGLCSGSDLPQGADPDSWAQCCLYSSMSPATSPNHWRTKRVTFRKYLVYHRRLPQS